MKHFVKRWSVGGKLLSFSHVCGANNVSAAARLQKTLMMNFLKSPSAALYTFRTENTEQPVELAAVFIFQTPWTNWDQTRAEDKSLGFHFLSSLHDVCRDNEMKLELTVSKRKTTFGTRCAHVHTALGKKLFLSPWHSRFNPLESSVGGVRTWGDGENGGTGLEWRSHSCSDIESQKLRSHCRKNGQNVIYFA